jgi:hypothetical protein
MATHLELRSVSPARSSHRRVGKKEERRLSVNRLYEDLRRRVDMESESLDRAFSDAFRDEMPRPPLIGRKLIWKKTGCSLRSCRGSRRSERVEVLRARRQLSPCWRRSAKSLQPPHASWASSQPMTAMGDPSCLMKVSGPRKVM